MTTRRRREAMLAIVTGAAVATQDELADALRKRGFVASQASVSRDIAALGLVKVRGRYARATTAAPSENPMLARIRSNVLRVRSAGDNLLVLSTPPGEASPVAIAIDGQDWPGVAGTIAGDDTIFVALSGENVARDVGRRLRKLGVKI